MSANTVGSEPTRGRHGRRSAASVKQPWPTALDGRTRAARRVAAIAADLLTTLGAEPDRATMLRIRRCAELLATAESLRAKALEGEADCNTIAAIVKIENAASRCLRELGLNEPRQAPTPTLAQYLAARRDSER